MIFKRKKKKLKTPTAKKGQLYNMGTCPYCSSSDTAQVVMAAFTAHSQLHLEERYAKHGVSAVFVYPEEARDLDGANAFCKVCRGYFVGHREALSKEDEDLREDGGELQCTVK